MKDYFVTSLGRLRMIGFLEGMSFLILLLIAMPLKYMAGMPEAVKVTGMAHGLLFVMYIVMVMLVRYDMKWDAKTTLLALGASVVPFGTFYADKKWFKPAA